MMTPLKDKSGYPCVVLQVGFDRYCYTDLSWFCIALACDCYYECGCWGRWFSAVVIWISVAVLLPLNAHVFRGASAAVKRVFKTKREEIPTTF